MTTRIKIIEKNNGEKIYIPQARGFHKNHFDLKFFCMAVPVVGWAVGLFVLTYWDVIDDYYYHDSEHDAKIVIDKYLEKLDSEYADYIANETKKTSYVKYP